MELVVEACWAWLAAALEMVVEVAAMGVEAAALQHLGEVCFVDAPLVLG